MGCNNSKTINGSDPDLRKKGEIANLTDPAAPPPTDDRLPLNARQVFKLKKSWKGIKRNMQETGVEMFIRLFRTNHELKTLFKDFGDLKGEDDMRDSVALEHHGFLVMSILDEAITHIDDVDHVLDVCSRVGGSHAKFSGFYSDLFQNIEEPLNDAIKFVLGDAYSDQMEEIYRLTLHFVVDGIRQACEKAACNNHVTTDSDEVNMNTVKVE